MASLGVGWTVFVIVNATCTVLRPLDKLQDSFLRNSGVTTLEGLMEFNLAPLATRRDMAMLGLIHRTALKKGPQQFQQFFFPATQRSSYPTRQATRRARHGAQLKDWRHGTHLNAIRRSALGLVAVYNLLPPNVVKRTDVKEFQKKLQDLVKERAAANCEDWAETFSPRVPLYGHPLK